MKKENFHYLKNISYLILFQIFIYEAFEKLIQKYLKENISSSQSILIYPRVQC